MVPDPDRFASNVLPTDDDGGGAIVPQREDSPAEPAPGTRRLMRAVLADALHVFLTHMPRGHTHADLRFREVEQWFRSRDTQWPFSFERVCEALDLDPGRLRRRLSEHRCSAFAGVVPEGGKRRVTHIDERRRGRGR
jgi:hypothetical protein